MHRSPFCLPHLISAKSLPLAALLALVAGPIAKAEFSAYNDIASGPGTHPNTTL